MPFVTVGEERGNPVELYYEDHGSGRPVVLIHSWPLSGRSWELQVPALVAAGHRVVAYDRRGFGRSSQPWHGYDYDTMTADLRILLEHLGLTEVTLVGYSMGGGEAVRYLSRYGPGRVAGLVLAASVTPYLYRTDDNPEGGLDDDTIGGFEQGVTTDRMAFLDGFFTEFFTGDRDDLVSEPMRLHHRDMAAFASPKATLDCAGALSRTDFRDDVAKIGVPTLVVHGDADRPVPFEVSGRRTHAAIPGSKLELVPGAPHGLNVSHAATFNRTLLDFLAR